MTNRETEATTWEAAADAVEAQAFRFHAEGEIALSNSIQATADEFRERAAACRAAYINPESETSMTTIPLIDWTKPPLWQVQKAAVFDPAAAVELARRYAVDARPMPDNATRHQVGQLTARRRRLAAQWLLGWRGGSDPYFTRPNFYAPERSAHRDGQRKRREIETLVAQESEEK